MRTLGRTFLLTLMVLTGLVGLLAYHNRTSQEHQIEELTQQKQELEQVIGRLETERRVAKILVSDQKIVNGQQMTTLLFVEYRKDGTALAAKQFTIIGNEAHFDAQIIKFNDDFVQAGDPLRGQSILLFNRVYGAHQAPADGFPIDTPGSIPEIYRGIDPKVSAFEQDLWSRFWTLYNDKDAREARGIRGLHGEGLYGQFDPDHVYTITLRDSGGTIMEEPIEPIYREAMHRP